MQPGPSATFVATRPGALLLFAGDYSWRAAGSLVLINERLSPKAALTLRAGVDSIAAFYGAMLGVPFGDSAWRARLGGYAESWQRDSASKALDRITVARDLHELYRYQYLPVMLSALEGIVGTGAMDRFLRVTIQGGPRGWDYEQLKAFVLEAGITEATWMTFHEQCIRAPDHRGCVALATQGRN